jgi:penicillin-binding protein 1C
MGRNDAAPILLKVFDLLPPDRNGRPGRPADAIVAANPGQLPAGLRTFVRRTAVARMAQVSHVPPPAISFPPDGAIVQLSRPEDENHAIALKVTGGRAPFTWMVDGAVIGNYDRFEEIAFEPGEGFSRITVIDADGNSATSRVRFKAPRG